MDIRRVVANTNIRPTDRKIKQAKKVINNVLGSEKPISAKTTTNVFDGLGKSIRNTMNNMRKN